MRGRASDPNRSDLNDVPTPFHVYDEKGIRENARRINKAFSWNKGFKEYFAVKALPNPVILQILQEEGCGVDCSSLTELMLSEVCGFTGSDIMFSSNQTPVEDMQKAYELGAYINLDDATMVDFLDRVAGVPETVFCRYNPGGTFSLGESEEGFQVMDKPGDAKYGMTEEQMIDSYKKLMAKGAKHFGIHAFLASNTISDAYYPELAAILFRLAVRGHEATGAHIGYPGARRHGRRGHLQRDGPLHHRALRCPGGNRHPRKAHLQGVHRSGRLRGQPDAPGHVRGLSSHHRAGQGGRPLRPHV